MHTHHGFTLTELLSMLMIASIILVAGAPALSTGLDKAHAQYAMQSAFHTIQEARTLAINQQNGVITLCGSTDGHTCNKDWSHGWLLFADTNDNRRHDSDETLYRQETHDIEGSMHWSASGGRPYIRFTPLGYSMEFGALTYCPSTPNPHHARQITINRPGRARLSRDRDHDGIHEDTYNKPLNCET